MSGCTDSSDAARPATTIEQPPAADETEMSYNAADMDFARTMTAHVATGVAMAELASAQADDGAVASAAQRTLDDLTREVDVLTAWAAERGTPPTTAPAGADTALDELTLLNGPAFDALFLDLMTKHHRASIEIAEEVRAAGQSPELLEFAARVIDDRHHDITELEQLAGDARAEG